MNPTTTAQPIVTFFDGAADIAKKEARYSAVAGRVSILRGALKRIEREIEQIHEAVDAEEDGAELLFAHLPTVRVERARLELLIAPLEIEEREVIKALGSYGIKIHG